jgi:hypothetical protein
LRSIEKRERRDDGERERERERESERERERKRERETERSNLELTCDPKQSQRAKKDMKFSISLRLLV